MTQAPLRTSAQQASTYEMVLIFRLSGEVFAISVSRVHEILDPIPVTEVPNASVFAPALVNVRGAIVPLIDIRQRLRMPPENPSNSTRMVVLELPVSGVPTRLAIITDAVEEVVEADMSALESIPDLGSRWSEQYVSGVIRYGSDLAICLDTANLFSPDPERFTQV